MLSCALLFHCCLCRCYILCRLKLLSHTYCLHWWRIYRFIKSLDADVFSEQQARWRAHFNAVIILVYRCASYKAFVPVIVLFWLVDCTLHSSCTMWGCCFFFQLYSLLSIPRVVICSVFQTDLNYLKFPTSSLQFTDYVMQHCPLQACRVKTLMHKGENKPIKRNKTYLAGQARYVDGWQRWRNLESSTGTYLQIGVFIWIYDFPLFFWLFFSPAWPSHYTLVALLCCRDSFYLHGLGPLVPSKGRVTVNQFKGIQKDHFYLRMNHLHPHRGGHCQDDNVSIHRAQAGQY